MFMALHQSSLKSSLIRYILLSVFMAFLSSTASAAVPISKEQVFQFGALAARDGELDKAADLFKKVTEMDPRFAPAYNALGLIYQSWPDGGNMEESVRYFKLALNIDPNYVECLNNLGRAYYSQGVFTRAEQIFNKSLEINADQPQIELAMGWIYLLGESRAEESIDHFERGIAKDDNGMAHYGLGLASLLKGDRFKVLEQVTALRHKSMEEQAAKLENMIRQNIRLTSTPGMPLVTGKEAEDSLFQKELAALGKTVANDDNKGIQVRLKGNLW